MVDTIRPLFGCHRRLRSKAPETAVAIDAPEIAPGETRGGPGAVGRAQRADPRAAVWCVSDVGRDLRRSFGRNALEFIL